MIRQEADTELQVAIDYLTGLSVSEKDIEQIKVWVEGQRRSWFYMCKGQALEYFDTLLARLAWLVEQVESLRTERDLFEKSLDTQRGHTLRLTKERDELRAEVERLKIQVTNVDGTRAKWLACALERQDQISDLTAQLTLSQQSAKEQFSDAERWRALIGCARVRVLGSAGIVEPKPDGYAHIGVELWTHHTANSEPKAIEWLTKFADAAIREAAKEGNK